MVNRLTSKTSAKRVLIDCQVCKKSFLRFLCNVGRKFCSRECYDSTRKRIALLCSGCSTSFTVPFYRVKRAETVYCSPTCATKAQRSRVERVCPVCSGVFNVAPYVVRKGEGVFCSKKCRGIAERGENHHNWQGGKKLMSQNARGIGWANRSREVRKRADYTCQDCGKAEFELGHALHAHHIVPFYNFANHREANSATNLTALCRSCHTRREWANEYGKQEVFIGKFETKAFAIR